jgi:DNA polymerase III subunit beta
MKVTVSQKNLKMALGLAEKVVSKNNSLPILNNILLKTENGRFKICATNLEIGVNANIGARVEEEGEITVPGKIITEFVNHVGDEAILITAKNNILIINSETYKTQILGMSAKDYPIIPKVKGEYSYQISSQSLKNALSSTLSSVSSSDSRPELGGMFISFSQNGTIFASTDGFRLTEKKIIGKNEQSKSIILPRNTVSEVIRLCGESDGDITVRIEEGQVSFSSEDFELVSRLIDGNYPEYSRLIPESHVSKALIDKSEFEKNIRLAGLFSSSISDIKLSCKDDKLTILANNSDRGEINTTIDALLKNDPFEVALNFNYLLDGLKVIGTDKIVMEFTGTTSPLILRPHDDKKDTLYLIMPLRN